MTLYMCTDDTIWTLRAYLFHTGGVFEEDKAEASGPAAIRVKLDGAIRHLAKFGKVVLQVLFTCIPAEAAHKHFTVNTVETFEVLEKLLHKELKRSSQLAHERS